MLAERSTTVRENSLLLIKACKKGEIAAVREVLNREVDLDAKNGFAGWTALMWAAREGHKNIVRLLVEKGADPVKSSFGTTALLMASRSNHQEIIQFLEPYYIEARKKSRYGGVFARLFGKDKQKAKEEYYAFMKGLVRKRVYDPYQSGSIWALGDIFLESAMDGAAVYRTMEAYGIESVASVFDPTSNVTFRTVMMHGKHVALHDTFGSIISDPNNIPKLIPTSELHVMTAYLNNVHQPPEYWAGHVAERIIQSKLESLGYEAILPIHSNQAGFDLLVEPRFFQEHDLPFSEDLSTGLGKLQVKTVTDNTAVREHITKYVEHQDHPIPVIAPDDVVHHFHQQPILAFSDLGLDRDELRETVSAQLANLTEGHFADIPQGMHTSVFENAVHGYGGHGPELGIPYIGVTIASGLAIYRSYGLFTTGQIGLPQACTNVLKAGGTALVKGSVIKSATALTTGAVLTVLPGDSSAEVVGEGLSGAGHIINGDWDIGDVGEVAELALIVAVTAGTIWAVNKGLNWSLKQIKGAHDWFKRTMNPEIYARFEKVTVEFNEAAMYFRRTTAENSAHIEDAFGARFWKFQEDRLSAINSVFRHEKSFDNKKTLPSMRYFFLEYAKQKQESILTQMRDNYSNHPLSYVRNCLEAMKSYSSEQTDLQIVFQFAAFLDGATKAVSLPVHISNSTSDVVLKARNLSAIVREMTDKKLPIPSPE